jgi:hypothetical protein
MMVQYGIIEHPLLCCNLSLKLYTHSRISAVKLTRQS